MFSIFNFLDESIVMNTKTLQSDNNEVDIDGSSKPNTSTNSVAIVPSESNQANLIKNTTAQQQKIQQIRPNLESNCHCGDSCIERDVNIIILKAELESLTEKYDSTLKELETMRKMFGKN